MLVTLLALHSLVRWILTIGLTVAVCRAWYGWKRKQKFSYADDRLRYWTTSFAHLQLLLGLGLYYLSPITRYFWSNFPATVKERGVRFFGMEHSLMMLIAVIVLTIGSARVKQQPADNKFKTMAIWFTIVFFIIFTSIPWQFSPFTSRPYWRPF